MANIIGLQCVSCAKQYEGSAVAYTCPQCGPLHGTLDVVYDYAAIAKKLTRAHLRRNRDHTLWRYSPLLPIIRSEFISPLTVGGTPLYKAPGIAAGLGIAKLWIKDDGRNPTGSLKDRASAVAIVKAQESGAKNVTAASTGNAASSWAAFTALAQLKTTIFVPQNAPEPKLAQLMLFGATVIQVKGNYDSAFDLCCRAADKWGWYNRSTAINPYLGEGKKTVSFEICEQLGWHAPDVVLVSVGDGCILQGMWKGFSELHRLNLIDRLPRLVGVQASGSAPLVEAWHNAADCTKTIMPQTFADSIAVGLPRDQIKALRAVRESNGLFVAVSDDQIRSAIRSLATEAGVFAEPAGAASFAGLKQIVDSGVCHSGSRAVVVVTGNGLKDTQGVMSAVANTPIVVDDSLASVSRALQKASSGL